MKGKSHLAILAAAVAISATLPSAQARTLTLSKAGTSSAPNTFSAAATWKENGSTATTGPQPGDTLIINVGTAYFAAEDFNIGAAGLTLDVRKTTECYVKFTGTGALTINATAEFILHGSACTYQGGTTITGTSGVKFYNSHHFGTGDITIVCASSNNPTLIGAAYGKTITNNIVIAGSPAKRVIGAANRTTFKGTISSHDDSFMIDEEYDNLFLNGDVSVPAGKTITLRARSKKADTRLQVNGALNGNLFVKGRTSASGTTSPVQLNTTSVCSGTEVSVDTNGWLQLTAAGNLNPNATLTVAEGGIVEVSSGVIVKVTEFIAGNRPMPVGCFKSNALPNVISGSGAILVTGEDADIYTWTGADANNPTNWYASANWDRNAVPGNGVIAFFPAAATIVTNSPSQTIALGSEGLTIVAAGTLNFYIPFSGSGTLTFASSSQINLYCPSTHTGGTILGARTTIAAQTKSTPLGTGTVTIDGSSGCNPELKALLYSTSFRNDISICGIINESDRAAIYISDRATFHGAITGDDNIRLLTSYGMMILNGAVTVPQDKTITFQVKKTSKNENGVEVNSALNGDLAVVGLPNTAANATYYRPVRLGATTVCSGTNISVSASGILKLTARGNLREDAIVTVADNGKISIDAGVKAVVAKLVVDGVNVPHAHYTAATLPAVLVGDGRLRVGPPDGFMLVVR